jgi:SAM-dependent methyltransferase
VLSRARQLARDADRRVQIGLQQLFERRYGVDTLGKEGLDERGLAAPDRIYHAASPTITLRRALERAGAGPADVLADVGSGKGHALIVAGQLPYRRIIGVELAEDWNRIAQQNVERAKPRLACQDYEFVTGDALEWEIPDDLTVVYMYCPFLGSTFDAFLERLVAAYDRHPRPLRLVYGYAFEHNRIVRHERFAVVDVNCENWPRRPGWWDGDHVIVTYKLLAPGEGPPPQNRKGYGQDEALAHWSGPNDTHFELHPPDGPPIYSQPA